ncbi:hypothetical protein Tcan_16059 [Toxocara canis]|uniref:Uncharacterized protein n=1 Tax=Toxocara canis TaxID=6265 RepID=A0A0B2VIY5_TOXCA|nr:hypothetical protein Tcan_16059 [Toxocara canis]
MEQESCLSVHHGLLLAHQSRAEIRLDPRFDILIFLLEMLKERDLKPKECWMPACSLRESVETIATLVKVILMVALLVYAGAAMTVTQESGIPLGQKDGREMQ